MLLELSNATSRRGEPGVLIAVASMITPHNNQLFDKEQLVILTPSSALRRKRQAEREHGLTSLIFDRLRVSWV